MIPEPPPSSDSNEDITPENESLGEKLLRLFAHGLLFSLIVGNLGTLLVIVLFPLAALFFILGLIMLIFVLIALVGWTNVKLADYLWNIKCTVNVKSYLGHGVLLIITFFLFYIPIGAWELVFLSDYPSLALASRLIAEQFLDPNEYVGGSLRHRRGTRIVDYGMTKPKPIQGVCPHCSASHWYDESSLAEDGSLQCKSCGERYIYKKVDSAIE